MLFFPGSLKHVQVARRPSIALGRDVGLNYRARAADSGHAKAIFRPILTLGPSAALAGPSGSARVVWVG